MRVLVFHTHGRAVDVAQRVALATGVRYRVEWSGHRLMWLAAPVDGPR